MILTPKVLMARPSYKHLGYFAAYQQLRRWKLRLGKATTDPVTLEEVAEMLRIKPEHI